MQIILDSFTNIEKNSSEPIYRQIIQAIEQRIHSGEWVPGRKLPSENELVASLAVSRMTINRALRELTQQGLITRVHGIGSFVAEQPRHASLIELKDIALEVIEDGDQHGSKVIALETRHVNKEIADAMQVSVASELYYLQAIHYQNGVPIQLETRYVNPQLVPEFSLQDFEKITATAYLLQQFRPDEMEHVVSAINPDRQTSYHLKINTDQPCLLLTRRTWIENQVVTRVTFAYPGDRYELGARYATNDYQPRKSRHGG